MANAIALPIPITSGYLQANAVSLLGNPTGVTTTTTNITLGSTLTFSGSALQTLALSGDVTSPANSFVTTLANNAVTTAKIANGAVDLTTKVSGILPIANGGTNLSTYTLGDTLYASAANVLSKLSGNITTTKQYLSQTGTGVVSAAPVWSAIAGTDVTGAALTSVNDTNITLTLGGTPATALLRAASITAGWTGLLSIARGGNNIGSQTTNGVLFNNGTANTSSANFTYDGVILNVQGGAANTITRLFSLQSPRSFATANDGVMFAGISSGILGTHDYGAIVMGSNPASSDGGASLFQLRVGGSSTNTTNNGVFLQALSTSSNVTSEIAFFTGSSTKIASFNASGVLNLVSLTASQMVFTDASQNLVSVTMSGDATITGAGVLTIANNAITTPKIANNAVTYAKFQQVNANSLVGNPTGALANATNVTLGSTLTFSGSALQTLALSGDVTSPANSFVTTIANNAVTTAKIANGAVDLTTKVTGVLPPANGGTGVNNGSSTVTLGGNFTTSGANPLTLTTTGSTNVTLPTSGTLATTSQVIQWSATASNITLTANFGIIPTSSSLVTLTLPASPNLGSVFYVAGQGSGGWQIAQAANQVIHFGGVNTTTGTGGSLSSTNRYDSVMLVCVVGGANAEFTVVSVMGNVIFN